MYYAHVLHLFMIPIFIQLVKSRVGQVSYPSPLAPNSWSNKSRVGQICKYPPNHLRLGTSLLCALYSSLSGYLSEEGSSKFYPKGKNVLNNIKATVVVNKAVIKLVSNALTKRSGLSQEICPAPLPI